MQTAACLFAAVALVSFFLPWHEIRDGGLGNVGCLFMPDCHLPPPPSEAEILARAPDAVHTGLAHDGPIPVYFLALLLGAELLSLFRPRFWIGLGTAAAGLVGMGLLGVALFDLGHMFDHTRSLPGEQVHGAALVGLALAMILDLALQPILYVGARRAAARAAAVPEVPSARVVR